MHFSWRGFFAVIVLLLSCLTLWTCNTGTPPQERADHFLEMYNTLWQKISTVFDEAAWKSATDVNDLHTGERIGAEGSYAAFTGSKYIIEQARELLQHRAQLSDLSVRELDRILLMAAEYPGTIPDVVAQRVAAEAKQGAVQDGFEFCMDRRGDKCTKPITPNEIDEILVNSRNEAERRKAWEVSKQSGPALKSGLVDLQRLRNQVAKEMQYSSFFGLQVADYGMKTEEMMQMMERFNADLKPLYEQLHCWTKYKLAERYKQPVPKRIPAHWIGNRWAQAWPGLTEAQDLDALFKDKTPEWIVRQGERFYTSLGMAELPQSFWEKSDLYQLPAGATRKKNTHASAWHIDYDTDVRSLMSVESNFRWFETSHHELGHIYYYMAYSRPEVPFILREGANRAFHEAIGDLISIAARQPAYLKEIGILQKDAKIDEIQWLLNEALDQAVVFIPFSAGTMSFFEHDLYEDNLPVDQFNKRWWDHAARFQGIEPPSPRGEEFCDACTKTHINDDPAEYYDYAMAFVIKYQLHTYIAKNILKQDPRNCNYYGNKQAGDFLMDILRLGATRDWREVIKEKTGEEISTRAMLEYFAPLLDYLKKENAGREVAW